MFKAHRYARAFLLVAGLAVSAPACASSYYPYQGGGYSRDVERRAYDNGYRDGVSRGERDARSGRPYSVERQGDWRDADDGYRRSDGDRDFYRRAFRQGFQTGYREGFDRYGRGGYGNGYPRTNAPYGYPSGSGPSYGYSSPAAQIGYRDGYEVGRNDARDRDRFDPVRSSRYRSADHDYDRRYGSKDDYKRVYRDAFQQGYSQGYRENQRGR